MEDLIVVGIGGLCFITLVASSAMAVVGLERTGTRSVLCCRKCLRIVAWNHSTSFRYFDGGCVCRPAKVNVQAVADLNTTMASLNTTTLFPLSGTLFRARPILFIHDEARWERTGWMTGAWVGDRMQAERVRVEGIFRARGDDLT